MHPESIAVYMGIAAEDAGRLLALPPANVYADPVYQCVIASLNMAELRESLVHVRAIYDAGLEAIKVKHGLSGTIMSGFTLGNWVLGFLDSPDHLHDLLKYHARIPAGTIEAALSDLVALLDGLPAGRAAWQRALVTFGLPLIAGC